MENWAKSRKAVPRPAPCASAESRASWLAAVALRPASSVIPVTAPTTASPWAAASSTSPVLATMMVLIRPGEPAQAAIVSEDAAMATSLAGSTPLA